MKGISIIVFLFALVSLTILMNAAANWLESQPSASDQKFQIVDTYKGCDVVQYTPTNAARYHYFLDCTEELMNAMPYGGTSIQARKEKYD
jgi:hypothetical protein